MVRTRVREEALKLEQDFADQKNALERKFQCERNHDLELLDQAKRERQIAEDNAYDEAQKVRSLQTDADELRARLRDVS